MIRCHMIKQHTREQCTAEAISDEPDDIPICFKHAAEVMRLVTERIDSVRAAKTGTTTHASTVHHMPCE